MIMQILILSLLLFALPVLVGGSFSEAAGKSAPFSSLVFRWVSGQMCLWTGFLAICLPMILLEREDGFARVIRMNGLFAAAMLLFSLGRGIKRRAGTPGRRIPAGKREGRDPLTVVLGLAAVILLALQLALAAALAYEEGDDAFYVAVSSVTNESGTMYKILPYTGGGTSLDIRHGLAPFPIWVALLARVSGMHAATVAQVVLPVTLILMAYGVFYLMGGQLFREEPRKRILFLLLIELMVLFGGQSRYTAENFLLVRTAQGKAVLAALVIPFLFLLLMILAEKLKEGKKTTAGFWMLMELTLLAGCLCSTQGTVLTGVFFGAGALCVTAGYRKWKLLLPSAACCLLPAVIVVLYFVLS
ncbi:MAG: DUF6077 domain-containing protein [Roseburia sp.]|nr:DUF6077 domain-containing protein [Roseburia sp.]MCM1098628.1 DUF6077 domain-containing protein [Ruminococcus flavefaciens]